MDGLTLHWPCGSEAKHAQQAAQDPALGDDYGGSGEDHGIEEDWVLFVEVACNSMSLATILVSA